MPPRREFWGKQYAAVKAASPKVPILLREASGTPASVTGVYEFGVEKKVSVEGMSADAFKGQLDALLKGSGK